MITTTVPPSSDFGRVSIRPGVSVLSVLRHLNYKPWFALAEFVDNSIQSFLTEREKLRVIHGPDVRLTVSIDIETSPPGRISIRDNAAGIGINDFPRAFRPAAVPPDRTGLSEFGMGMKSAACWFAPRWQVRTKALGEAVERTVTFDINQIVNGQLEEIAFIEAPANSDDHFTEVILDNPYHLPLGRTVGKIKDHLTDIYRTFTRGRVLELKVCGLPISYTEPMILRAPYVRSGNGVMLEWRKPIEFDFGNGLSVAGFAALRDPGSFSKSGFALFRRGRLIQGSGDEGYRPDLIFGKPNSFRSLRLFGELHLEGFDVSHTKDGFRWDENEQPFLEILKEHLDAKDLPLLKQAENYRVQAPKNEAVKVANLALASTAAAMESSLPRVLPQVVDQPTVETQDSPLADEPTLAARELTVLFRGRTWVIRVQICNDPAESQWLSMSSQVGAPRDPEILEIRLSLAHPFMVTFAQNDPTDIEALLRVGAALAIAEKLARDAGIKMCGTIRRNMNEILREAFSQIS